MTYVVSFPHRQKWLFRKLFTVPDQCFLFIFLTGENFEPVSYFFRTFSCEGSLDGLEKILCAILSLLAFVWCCFLCYTRLKKRKLFVISNCFSVTLNVPTEQLQSLAFKRGCHVNGIEKHFPR